MMFSRTGQRKNKAAKEFVWPAPVAGLIRSGNPIKADPRGCEVLENWIPTAEGAKMRGGAIKRATVDGDVKTMFNYSSGTAESLFAATDSSITDVTSVADAETELLPTLSGFNEGQWSSVQFATSGGEFVIACNGRDKALRYNGTDWQVQHNTHQNNLPYDTLTAPFLVGQTVSSGSKSATIIAILPSSATAGILVVGTVSGGSFSDNDVITSATGAALVNGSVSSRSTTTFDGVDSALLSFVWQHKRRLWFVEKDTLSAWYLPVVSIAGTAVEFPLQGIFRLGGSLLFGGSWSQDSGAGLDDLAVFVSTEGEIAVYQGSDPSDSANWALVGVYTIGKPLGKNSWFKAGGDLIILTEDGIVSASEALKKDRAALQASAITAPIEGLWQEAIAARTVAHTFTVALWATETTLWINIPKVTGGIGALVANTRTGAWATLTGWSANCFTVFADKLYYGANDGVVAQGNIGGSDLGEAYSAKYAPRFQELGSTGDKMALHARYTLQSTDVIAPNFVCFSNYQIDDFPPENEPSEATVAIWGSAVWGSSKWGGSTTYTTTSQWQSVYGMGQSLTLGLILGSNGAQKPTAEIVSVSLRYETGSSI